MQVVLYLTVLMGFSYIGYGFGNYYVKRTRFLEDLVQFANSLKVQIGFSNNTLNSIVRKSIAEYDSSFRQVLKSYLKVLKKSDYVTVEELNKNLKNIYLEENENHVMLQFFNFLGKSDAENQISSINGYLNSFNAYLAVSKIHKEKYASLFKKLGFMVGLVICIILL